jgi:hypothetical protein
VAFWNEDVRVIAYLDDGFLQGAVKALRNAYMDLKDVLAKVGLFLKPEECTAYSANESNVQDVARLVGCKALMAL